MSADDWDKVAGDAKAIVMDLTRLAEGNLVADRSRSPLYPGRVLDTSEHGVSVAIGTSLVVYPWGEENQLQLLHNDLPPGTKVDEITMPERTGGVVTGGTIDDVIVQWPDGHETAFARRHARDELRVVTPAEAWLVTPFHLPPQRFYVRQVRQPDESVAFATDVGLDAPAGTPVGAVVAICRALGWAKVKIQGPDGALYDEMGRDLCQRCGGSGYDPEYGHPQHAPDACFDCRGGGVPRDPSSEPDGFHWSTKAHVETVTIAPRGGYVFDPSHPGVTEAPDDCIACTAEDIGLSPLTSDPAPRMCLDCHRVNAPEASDCEGCMSLRLDASPWDAPDGPTMAFWNHKGPVFDRETGEGYDSLLDLVEECVVVGRPVPWEIYVADEVPVKAPRAACMVEQEIEAMVFLPAGTFQRVSAQRLEWLQSMLDCWWEGLGLTIRAPREARLLLTTELLAYVEQRRSERSGDPSLLGMGDGWMRFYAPPQVGR